MLKLIGFKISGHDLFEDESLFTLQTASQVTKNTKNRTIQFNSVLTINRTIGIVGLNASGKTTMMSIFKALNDFYLRNLSIDQTTLIRDFRSTKNLITIEAMLASTNNVRYKVITEFSKVVDDNSVDDGELSWIITNEKVFEDKRKKISKEAYFTFDEAPVKDRATLTDDIKMVLSDTDSLFRMVKRDKYISNVISTTTLTNINVPRVFKDETPIEILVYLDNSIEYLKHPVENDKTTAYQLKFKGSDDVIKLAEIEEILNYISSGTIKGITLFYEFVQALRIGATLFVDEIELHVNRQIIRDFISFFANPDINVNNATLVYSTHYIELTDDLLRKDEEYVFTRQNLQTTIHRLNEEDVRVELKNSEIFKANTITGTAPSHKRYLALRKEIQNHNLINEKLLQGE